VIWLNEAIILERLVLEAQNPKRIRMEDADHRLGQGQPAVKIINKMNWMDYDQPRCESPPG
jgi:hypothetical protein